MGRCSGFIDIEDVVAGDSDVERNDVDNFLPLDAVGENLLEWHAGEARVSLGSVLTAEAPTVSGFVTDCAIPAVPQAPQQWCPDSFDPSNLLRRALRENHPELYVPHFKVVRRLSGKQAPPLGRALRMLQSDPRALRGKALTRESRILARDEFVRVYARASGYALRSIRKTAVKAFHLTPPEERTAWLVVQQIGQLMYDGGLGKPLVLKEPCPGFPHPCPPVSSEGHSSLPSSFDAFGVLLTWQVSIGLDDPAVWEIFERHATVPAQAAAMACMPTHQWHFQAFNIFVEQSLASAHGFSSWAACMELSTCAVVAGRIHLHAFIGPAIRDNGFFGGGTRKISVKTESLSWHGNCPNVSLMQVRARRPAKDGVAGGMYYVLSKKVGSVFRAGSAVLFQDGHECCWAG